MPEAFTAMASANYGFTHFMNGNVAMSYNTGRWGFRMNYNGKMENDLIESELHRQLKQTGSILDQFIEAEKRTTGQNLITLNSIQLWCQTIEVESCQQNPLEN